MITLFYFYPILNSFIQINASRTYGNKFQFVTVVLRFFIDLYKYIFQYVFE